MQIAKIDLQNIACFESLSLDFTQVGTHKAAPWVILLGENGTGKSTLLQMIGATIYYRQIHVVAGNIDFRSYMRDRYSNLTFSLNLIIESGDSAYGSLPSPTEFRWIMPGIPKGQEPGLLVNMGPITNQRLSNLTSEETSGWFICGYGTTRRISGQPVNDRDSIPTFDDSAKPYRLVSLLGDPSGMTNVPDWLAGLYFRVLHPDHTDVDSQRFDLACEAILRALPHVSKLEVTQDRQVIVTEGSTRVPLERLSDGYRGTLAWVGDLIRRLFDAYPESPDPLKERGVVLVDEIDLHLHPRWQRSVVEDIRKLFPNLQFIVTTHSPFVAQDMREEDRIIVLERSGKNGTGAVVAREGLGVLQDWTADQILAAYFNLPRGTRSEATQREEARYERLLDAEATRTLTKAEQAELERLRPRMDRIPIGSTPDEQSFDRVAENVLASLRQRREELEALKTGAHGSKEESSAESAD